MAITFDKDSEEKGAFLQGDKVVDGVPVTRSAHIALVEGDLCEATYHEDDAQVSVTRGKFMDLMKAAEGFVAWK